MWCIRYGSYIGSSSQYCLDVSSLCVALRTTECPRSVRFSIAAPPVAICVPCSKQHTLSTVYLEDVSHDYIFIVD